MKRSEACHTVESKQRSLLQQDLRGIFDAGILGKAPYELALREVRKAFNLFAQRAERQELAFLEVPFRSEDFPLMRSVVERMRSFKAVLILCSGHIGRNSHVLSTLFQSSVAATGSFPRLYFLTEPDPELFWEVLSVTDPKTTGVLAISPSGNEEGVILALMRCIEYWGGILEKSELAERFLVCTSMTRSFLRRIALHFSLPMLDLPRESLHPLSSFSVEALLPAALVGFDAKKFRAGAALTCNQTFFGQLHIPLEGAALFWACLKERRVKGAGLITYGEAAKPLEGWHRELWRSSEFTVPHIDDVEREVFPHIFYTIVEEVQMVREKLSPELWTWAPDLSRFAQSTLADLVLSRARAQGLSLLRKRLPLRMLRIMKLNEEVLGALMMNCVLEKLIIDQLLAGL